MIKIVRDLKFRRRREALTNYKKRYALVKSGSERVIVRKTNMRILGQIAKYSEKGDIILASAESNELKKFNWPSRANRSTAYLTGMLLAKKAGEGKKEHILDIGLSSPVKGSIPFVFAKGCVDGGLKIKGDFKIDEKIYDGSNVKGLEGLKEKNKHQHSAYSDKGINITSLNKMFNETKEKIMQHQHKK